MTVLLAACGNEPDTLIVDTQIVDDAIPDPLVPGVGDPNAGRSIFVDREGGHCVLCHVIDGLDAEFQGNVGPDLSAVGARLTAGQIRLRIADIERVAPGTIMPAYYRKQGLHQVAPQYKGKPVLSAHEIEHLVAYLSGLKGERNAG